MTKVCRFCGQETELVSSHIIPDFLFRYVKDKDGSIQRVNINSDNLSRKVKQGYFTDEKFLCRDCDNRIFSGWEVRASNFLRRSVYPVMEKVERQFGVKDVHNELITGLDYKQLKLFVLSVLWRAHHSEQAFFSKVDIGQHGPIIKEMLLRGDPGEQDLYEIAMLGIIDVTGKPFGLIVEPEVVENNGQHVCRFIMGSIAYLINLGGAFQVYQNFSLKSNGQLSLPLLSGVQSHNMLLALGLPKDMAEYFSFRIFSSKGDIVARAKEGHFDVVVNFCPCTGKRKGVSEDITSNFGTVDWENVSNNKDKLSRIYYKTVPLSTKHRKSFFLVEAYVRLDNRNARPFDLRAFVVCLAAINMEFKRLTVAMPKIWKGFTSWDFDNDRAISIIDRELTNCRVNIIEPN